MTFSMAKLVPAEKLAQRRGVQLLLYGGSGTAKTPLIATAPRPLHLALETGTGSLHSAKGVASYATNSVSDIEDFVKWTESSAETKNFDTFAIDSVSEMAEIALKEGKTKSKDGRAHYGYMSEKVRDWVERLRNSDKHIYLIAKLDQREYGEHKKCVPMFPGNALPTWVPHEIDEIYYAERIVIPGLLDARGAVITTPQLCWQTLGNFSILARSRSGKVDLYEYPDFSNLIRKIKG